MPPYPYLATDYGTQLSLFTHHCWIGGFCIVGAGAHAAIFMVRDYDPTNNYNNLLDRVIRHRDAIISHLNWVCIFLGFHSFGLYIHNDAMSALGRPQDMFSDTAIQLQPVFAQWIQNTHFLAPQLTAPNALSATSLSWGGDILAVGGKVAMMPISLGTSDFLVWLMLDQVKLRYMLEQLVLFYQKVNVNMRQIAHFFCKLTKIFFRLGMILKKKHFVLKLALKSYSHCINIANFLGLLGAMENLLGRVNQPVTTQTQKVGTSETIREAVCYTVGDASHNFSFSDYNRHKPAHIKNQNTDFLIWLIGFIEGDGSFFSRDTNVGVSVQINPETKRAEFDITQHIDNIKVLNKIRTELGFGRVTTFTKESFTYARWHTSKRANIICLIHLLNGNLILEKRRNQFSQWLNILNDVWGLNIQPKPFNCKVSLETPWLSGFSDADAGFFTNVKQDFRGSKRSSGGYYIKFFTKYYITQRDEINVLTEIRSLVGATNNIYKVTNGTTDVCYNRLEIQKAECIEILIQYFHKYPLKSIRKIDMLRWARVHAYKNMHVVATEAAAEKLARLIKNLQEPLDGLIVTDFSEEEKQIFVNLPLSQKN